MFLDGWLLLFDLVFERSWGWIRLLRFRYFILLILYSEWHSSPEEDEGIEKNAEVRLKDVAHTMDVKALPDFHSSRVRQALFIFIFGIKKWNRNTTENLVATQCVNMIFFVTLAKNVMVSNGSKCFVSMEKFQKIVTPYGWRLEIAWISRQSNSAIKRDQGSARNFLKFVLMTNMSPILSSVLWTILLSMPRWSDFYWRYRLSILYSSYLSLEAAETPGYCGSSRSWQKTECQGNQGNCHALKSSLRET